MIKIIGAIWKLILSGKNGKYFIRKNDKYKIKFSNKFKEKFSISVLFIRNFKYF